jgi:hypothetical protein
MNTGKVGESGVVCAGSEDRDDSSLPWYTRKQ